jgi:hypothetical protein
MALAVVDAQIDGDGHLHTVCDREQKQVRALAVAMESAIR